MYKTFFTETIYNQTKENVDRAIEIALLDIGQQILDMADETVPEKSGALRESGRVIDPVKNGDTWTLIVRYGNEQVEYAFFVHFNIPSPPELKNYSRPNSGPFFLQNAGDAIATPENIRAALQRAFKKI